MSGEFQYVVSLNVRNRRCVVLGGGLLALERVEGLLAAGADVVVYAAEPISDLLELNEEIDLHGRTYEPGDLDGAFLAVATREDDTDIEAAWDEAEEGGVLFAALDDIPHCHFAAPAIVRRGDLSVTVSTAGKAPALSKRLRQRFEQELGPEYGDLVEVLHDARQMALPRTVSFGEWAARWGTALRDLDSLVELVRQGRRDEAVGRILDSIDDDAETTLTSTPAEVDA